VSEQTVTFRMNFANAAQTVRELSAVKEIVKQTDAAITSLRNTASKSFDSVSKTAGAARGGFGFGFGSGGGGGAGGAPSPGMSGSDSFAAALNRLVEKPPPPKPTPWYSQKVGGGLGRAGDFLAGGGIARAGGGIVAGGASSAAILNLRYIEENAQRNNLDPSQTARAFAGSNAFTRTGLEIIDLATGREARRTAINERMDAYGSRLEASAQQATIRGDAERQLAQARAMRQTAEYFAANIPQVPASNYSTAAGQRQIGESLQDLSARDNVARLMGQQFAAGGETMTAAGEVTRLEDRERQLRVQRNAARQREIEAGTRSEAKYDPNSSMLDDLDDLLSGSRGQKRAGVERFGEYFGGDSDKELAAKREIAAIDEQLAAIAKEKLAAESKVTEKINEQTKLAEQLKMAQLNLQQNSLDRLRGQAAEGIGQATSFGAMTQFDRRAGVDALKRVLEVGLDNSTTDDIAAARSVAPKKVAELQQASGLSDPLLREVARISPEDARVTDLGKITKEIDAQTAAVRKAQADAAVVTAKAVEENAKLTKEAIDKFSNTVVQAITDAAAKIAKGI